MDNVENSIYKVLLQNESNRGEKSAWVFRWILYGLVLVLSMLVFFVQHKKVGFYGMILCTGPLTYNIFLAFLLRKKAYFYWVRYISATVDVIGLTLYNAFDTYFNSPLVPVTTATLILYPAIIFLVSLRLDRCLIIYSTLLCVISMDTLYMIAYPYFDPIISQQLVSSDILGQIYRTIYVLLCGFLMLFIPQTVERLLKNQQDMYKKNMDYYNLSRKDKLTGLGNRILFEEHLSYVHTTCAKNQTKYAIVYLDLDGFKQVNDSYGHSAGDQVLTVISQRILNAVRESDLICRIGGDEFVIIVSNIPEESYIETLAVHILEAIKSPILISQNPIILGASIGISIFPDHGNSCETLVKAADATMYSVKNSGKNRFAFYHDTIVV